MNFLCHNTYDKKNKKKGGFLKMITELVKSWENHKDELEMDIFADEEYYRNADYSDLVKKMVKFIFNTEEMTHSYQSYVFNPKNKIDDGDYQGTEIFFVNKDTYQPLETDYIVTFVSYGSCSGCDTLLSAQNEDLNQMVKDLMTIFLHMIQKSKYLYE